MRRTSVSLMLIVTMIALVLAPLAPAQAATKGLTVAVNGRAKNGPAVTGTFKIREFVKTGDPTNPIGAVGTLMLTTKDGRTAVTEATMPVKLGTSPAPAGGVSSLQLVCEILEVGAGRPPDLHQPAQSVHGASLTAAAAHPRQTTRPVPRLTR